MHMHGIVGHSTHNACICSDYLMFIKFKFFMSSIVSVRGEPVNVVVAGFAYDVSINKMQNIDT